MTPTTPATPETFVPRTSEEILAFIPELTDDFFGFTTSDLVGYLPFELAKSFLKEDTTAEQWAEPYTNTYDAIVQGMREYMSFAWDKANNERGLSASRTIAHYKAWLWLLKDDTTYAYLMDDRNYPPYGKPILRRICEVYHFPVEG